MWGSRGLGTYLEESQDEGIPEGVNPRMKERQRRRLAKESEQMLAGNQGVRQWHVTRAKGRSGYQGVGSVQ